MNSRCFMGFLPLRTDPCESEATRTGAEKLGMENGSDMSDVLAVRDTLFTYRCLRTSKSSASSASSARKSARSPTNRSRSYRILPLTLHHLIVTFKTL